MRIFILQRNNLIKRIFLALLCLSFFFLQGCGLIDYGEYNLHKEKAYANADELFIEFIDVGQGDSELIIFPNGKSMLIDTGEYYAFSSVSAALKRENIVSLDALIETHPHSDHMGGMSKIIEEFKPKTLYMPDVKSEEAAYLGLLEAINESKTNVVFISAGSEISLDDAVSVKVLSPALSEYENENDYSAVIRTEFLNTSFLFMGDAENAVEEELLKSGQTLKSSVIKLGHHGSETSSSKEFLSEVSPKYAVISCGKNNDYGHPHKSTLNILDELKIKYFRTDEDGSIIMLSNGSSIKTITPEK